MFVAKEILVEDVAPGETVGSAVEESAASVEAEESLGTVGLELAEVEKFLASVATESSEGEQ